MHFNKGTDQTKPVQTCLYLITKTEDIDTALKKKQLIKNSYDVREEISVCTIRIASSPLKLFASDPVALLKLKHRPFCIYLTSLFH